MKATTHEKLKCTFVIIAMVAYFSVMVYHWNDKSWRNDKGEWCQYHYHKQKAECSKTTKRDIPLSEVPKDE